MDIIFNHSFLGHDTGSHPENPGRLASFASLPDTELNSGIDFIPLVHTPEYIKKVTDLVVTTGFLDTDTVILSDTLAVASSAVGAAIMASEHDGFALIRPPGHHAFPDKGTGFCIFNNIAIATKKLVNEGKKVLIFDFDGHFGNGTANIFYDSRDVFYWSLHQEDAFPHAGGIQEIGSGDGLGYTMNMPLLADSGDDIYLRAVRDLLPIVLQFKPDIVAVSAGFDGHYLDPLLQLHLTTNTYFAIGTMLRNNFSHVFAVLEGGYNSKILSQGVYSFLDGINGRSQQFTEEHSESRIPLIENYEANLDALKKVMAPYWNIS